MVRAGARSSTTEFVPAGAPRVSLATPRTIPVSNKTGSRTSRRTQTSPFRSKIGADTRRRMVVNSSLFLFQLSYVKEFYFIFRITTATIRSMVVLITSNKRSEKNTYLLDLSQYNKSCELSVTILARKLDSTSVGFFDEKTTS
jgi:hypothetical protein